MLDHWIPAPRFHGGEFIPAEAGTGMTVFYETINFDGLMQLLLQLQMTVIGFPPPVLLTIFYFGSTGGIP